MSDLFQPTDGSATQRNRLAGDNVTALRSWRDCLVVHPAAAKMRALSRAKLIELGNGIKAHGLQIPIVLLETENQPPQVLDGCNRLDAMEAVGMPIVDIEGRLRVNHETIVQTKDFDPYLYVQLVNVDRRHLTPEQQRKTIEELLKAEPARTDRSIAKEVGVSHTTVANVRSDRGDNGQSGHNITRLEATGRKARGRKPGTKRRVDVVDGLVGPFRKLSVAEIAPVEDPSPLEEPADIYDPIESFAAQLRNLLLKGMADRPFAEWPRLVKRLREEISDVEHSFGRLRAEMEALGKCK